MILTTLETDAYHRIKDFISQRIDRRNSENSSSSPVTPSKYWQDFNRITAYVRRMPEEDLKNIRYHTWHINSDIYFTYYFFPHHIPKVIETYLGLSQTLDGFKPCESEKGMGFDTEYGKLSMDLLRYMQVLSDLYTHGKIWKDKPLKIVEIGGGYGHLARVFLSFNPETIYVICDLEETMFFQAVYLTNELGAERVAFLTGDEPEGFALKEGTVYLLPQAHSHLLAKYKFDVAINQQSMQEMTQAQVDNYCDLIKRSCNYFYSSNIDQHIDFIADRTGILKGVSDYLASKFTVEWSSTQPVKIDSVEESLVTNGSKNQKLSWWKSLFQSDTEHKPTPAPVSETDYGDKRVPRMIMKVK